ncbi:MAG: ABC transporter substrate-binding protein [Sphaerochaetaceae bacterium]
MKNKKALILLLALVVLFASACSKGGGAATDTAAMTTPAAETTAAAQTAPVVNEPHKDYVYKDAVATMSTNWNPHTYQTYDDAYPREFIRAGLYSFMFNDASHPVEGKEPFAGYVIVPEMAASMPVDVTEKVRAEHPEFNIPESATAGYAYTIDLNKAATWQDGTPINADTYVYSMQRLLDPKLLNYRAPDYYAQELCIAGAESYANSGNTIKKVNSSDGDALTYQISDLVKGPDGIYSTAEGYKCYFGLDEDYAWMGGKSLADYSKYFEEATFQALRALADDKGFMPLTDEAIELLYSFTGSDTWGNESREDLGYYVSYDFTYPEVDFSTVGIMKTGDYQITLVFGRSLAGFNLLYSLTSNWIVYKDLYESCLTEKEGVWSSTYNTNVATTMSYGPYIMTDYQTDKHMRFEKNEKWYGWTDGKHTYVDPDDGKTYTMYQSTAIDTQVVAEAATRKLMFLKGELMRYGLQREDFDSYRSSDYCHATPSETIFFLILNGYKEAIDNREASDSFDTSKYDLQTLTNLNFRKAVAVTYDKELFAATISPSRSGGYGIIGIAYLYDPETGSRYRDTDQAKKALCDFYSVDTSKFADLDDAVDSITGYDPERAKVLYGKAFEEALAAGFITDNDKDGISDQTIQIEYAMSSDSDFMTKTIDYLNEKMLEVTAGTPFAGKVVFVKSAPYGNEWSSKIRSGLSDTVLGGWSGSAFNPFSLTDLYVNPSKQYDAGWFDATKVSMTLTVDGEELTANLRAWSDALNGATVKIGEKERCFGDGIADVQTRLNILAALEAQILQSYDYLPMLQDASMALLSQQVFYVVEEYNPIMERGGIAYLKYNYDEKEWADYVARQGGELKY